VADGFEAPQSNLGVEIPGHGKHSQSLEHYTDAIFVAAIAGRRLFFGRVFFHRLPEKGRSFERTLCDQI